MLSTVLVTGGVRSGKSRHAESLLEHEARVRYIACGPSTSDADWHERIALHRSRRPRTWQTCETVDLRTAFQTEQPVLVECLPTWLSATVDAADMWAAPTTTVDSFITERAAEAAAALPAGSVVVTNEVGLGVVPSHRSGRLFRDLLGRVNQVFGASCAEVHLVVAGRVLRL